MAEGHGRVASADSAEEGIATDNLFSPNFDQPIAFSDPRRAMLGVRLNLGR